MVVPSQYLGDILKSYSKKHNLPLYTFAECMALSGGYWTLSVGNEKDFY